VVSAFLELGERTFVTQDSLTMLSEGMAARRPVCALTPHEVRLPPATENFVSHFLERQIAAGRMQRLPIAELSRYEPSSGPRLLDETYEVRTVQALATRLGLTLELEATRSDRRNFPAQQHALTR
jgi:mitochondrial fission protein ELM1